MSGPVIGFSRFTDVNDGFGVVSFQQFIYSCTCPQPDSGIYALHCQCINEAITQSK